MLTPLSVRIPVSAWPSPSRSPVCLLTSRDPSLLGLSFQLPGSSTQSLRLNWPTCLVLFHPYFRSQIFANFTWQAELFIYFWHQDLSRVTHTKRFLQTIQRRPKMLKIKILLILTATHNTHRDPHTYTHIYIYIYTSDRYDLCPYY